MTLGGVMSHGGITNDFGGGIFDKNTNQYLTEK